MNTKTRAVAYILGSAFCFSLMNFFVRLAGDLPFFEKVIFRNIVALFVAAFVLRKEHVPAFPRKKDALLMFSRICFGTVGLFANFYAIDHLVLSDASMLSKISPFSTMLFSFLFLREKVTRRQLLYTLGAFVGCAFVIKPEGSATLFPAMIGLLGGMSAGAAYASVRGLGIRGVAGPTIVFDFAFFSTLIALPLFIIGYVPMTLRQLLIMLAAGVCATIAQFALTIAYRYAPSREISIFDYSNVLFTAMFGFLFLSEIPDRWSLVGYGLTFSMALLMFLYNKKHVDMPEKP